MSPLIPPNAFFDFFPIKSIVKVIKIMPNNIPQISNINEVGIIQVKVAINKHLFEIFPTILAVFANSELLNKFLAIKIDNLPVANPMEKIATNGYPASNKANTNPSLTKIPNINDITP